MAVQSLKYSLLAGAVLLASGAAQAADYSPPPPPQMVVQPAPEPCCDTWYLRGFIGAGINANMTLEATAFADTYFASNSIADSYFIGGGAGYIWNNWLRFDVSAEYRAKTRITALAVSQPGGAGPVALDQYEGNLSSWVLLANAFVDLGTWNCFTPFVGAGVGIAYNTISNFTDVTPNVAAFGADGSSFGLGRGTSNSSLAWALYAGMSYAVTKNFTIDLTYRYLNYGTAKETVDCNGGSGCIDFEFKNLHSSDIMLGLRWVCCDLAPPLPRYAVQTYAPAPVYTQPQVYTPPPPTYAPPPAYSPPPMYSPPPLQSRG